MDSIGNDLGGNEKELTLTKKQMRQLNKAKRLTIAIARMDARTVWYVYHAESRVAHEIKCSIMTAALMGILSSVMFLLFWFLEYAKHNN